MKLFRYDVSDQFGYYRVANKKYYNKVEAIHEQQRTGVHLTFHYHDELYSALDWTQEPNETLPELYRARAEQLRSKYDYLVLCFSGGADSHNILTTFVDNDIKLDEIMMYHCLSTNPHEVKTNSEIRLVAGPALESIKYQIPETKIRYIDYSQNVIDYFTNDPDVDRAVLDCWGQFCPSGITLRKPHELHPDYLDIINSGKKIAFIIGYEKPRVWKVDGRWCFRFMDMNNALLTYGTDHPIECFYWNTDVPKILIKQAHIIKRYMELSGPGSPFITTEHTGFACRPHGNQTLWLNNHGVHTLIYPTWDINTYSAGKDTFRIMPGRDSWFWKDEHNSVRNKWHSLMEQWWTGIPDYWKNNPADMRAMTKHSWSIPYYLEKSS
jgi:hypothetical protein